MLILLQMLDRTRGLARRAGLPAAVAAVVLAGALAFAAADHRSLGTSLYWAVTTASTVGYGDVTPTTAWGRVVAVGVMLTAVPLLGLLFAAAASSASEDRLRRLFGLERRRAMAGGEMLVLGYTPRGQVAVRELLAAGYGVVLVADLPGRPLEHPRLRFYRADPTDEAALAGLEPAQGRGALVCLDADAETLLAAIAVRHLAPDLPIACAVRSTRVEAALKDLGVTTALPVDELVGHVLAKSVEVPCSGQLLLRLVSSAGYRLAERPVAPQEAGTPVERVVASAGLPLVLGVVHQGEVRLGVPTDAPLAAGDRLVVLEEVPGSPRQG